MKRQRVVIRETAEDDLAGIEEYLAEKASAEVAGDFLDAAEHAFFLLASQPEMGRRWEGGGPAEARAWPLRLHRGYLVLYRPLDQERGIEVLRVLSFARDIQVLLEDE